jgi:Zn-dependent metalloprotease
VLAQLRANAGGLLTQGADLNTAYTVLRAAGAKPLLQDNAAAAPLDRALSFLSLAGGVPGVLDPGAELQLKRTSTDAAGNTHVHLDQVHLGLPVFGARLVVHMNERGIFGVNGVFVPDLGALTAKSALATETLRATALLAAGKLHPDHALQLQSERFLYYRSGLLEGHAGKTYLAYEAMIAGAPGAAIRERIILNAVNGAVINRIDEVHTLLHRQIYTPLYHNILVLDEGDASAPADPPFTGDVVPSSRGADLPQNNLYIFAGGTYELYRALFGREGYDDGAKPPEAQRQESVYLVNENCPNAYWDGTSTNYCPGFDADDVVSHEWSHAYTEYTHGLVYQWQSGALNEAYSDIFGETYDLVNGIEGPLGVTLTEGEYYENGGSRWVIGEDLSEVAAALLLRDMWDPDAFPSPSPGSVITSPNYYCDSGDAGGVHTNSGVPNHTFAMLVDGKTYNGVVIPAIGLIKAAHIYFHAETHYQTPTTNFAQHADALEASCQDLIGAPLNDEQGNVFSGTISQTDCDAVHLATVATELRLSPAEKCEYLPLLQPEASTPAACAAGTYDYPDFTETWESEGLPVGWTVTNNFTGDAPEEDHSSWELSSELPAPHTGTAAHAPDPSGGGTPGSGKDLSGSTRLDSPEIAVPDDQSYLKFTHYMASEGGYDGGNLKYSVNGSDFALVPETAFTFNPYNTVLADPPLLPLPIPDPTGLTGNNTNPMASEPAFSGSDQGEATGSWGTSIVDLAALNLHAGDKLKLRFEFGVDLGSGNAGWFVDDLAVLHCSATAPPPSGGGEPVVRDTTRFGGAFGFALLLPLLGLAALRRPRWNSSRKSVRPE